MGEVYLGHDTLLDRPVAIKFISAIEPDALMREQFLTEARAAARLQHPNVVTVYRVGEIDGRPYIISEFVRGQNLDHIKLPMPWTRALELSIGLARGLAAAHRRGVLHRDIKPGNVILPADGEVKLLDFGLAKFVEAGVMQELLSEGPEVGGLDMTAPTLDIKAAVSSGAAPPLLAVDTQAGVKRMLKSALADTGDASKSDEEEAQLDDTGQLENAKTPPRIHVQYEALLGDASARSARRSLGMSQGESGGQGLDLSATPSSLSNSGIKGTPLYMAPEVLNGEPASRRSDIYSMGALIYELCVGSPPHYDPLASLEDLRQTVSTRDAPPLTTLVPNIDTRFSAVIERCLRRNPTERYSSAEELRDAVEQIADTAKKDEIPAGNPYRGLLPFEAEHRSLFFGRRSEIGTLIDRLRTEPFLLVAADSGVGKSSICRAGVLPLIAEGALGGNRTWQQVTLVPGRRPLASLVAALATVLAIDEDQLAVELKQEPSQLPRALNRNMGDGRGLVIFIDQMEELVTIGDKEESAAVGEALSSLTGRTGNVRIIGTVRSDFLARLASVPGLGDEISRALYILRPLSPDKIREVIVGPAHKKSVSFESETLVTHIVESTANADGGLPLLQFALAELWEVKSGDIITAQALESIGGVDGALARHGDHVLGRLPPEQRTSARRILMSLVTLEGTRARRSEEELVRDGASARGALEALVRGRLLVARDTPEGAAYEVAHEALIKGWDTLRKWLEEHAESRAVKQRLETAAQDWQRLGRPREVLWSARQIAETRLLEDSDIGAREGEFLAASRQQANRRRRNRQIALASVPIFLFLLYGMVRLLAAHDLDKQISANLNRATTTIASARAIDLEVERLRISAFALFDSKKREEAEKVWEDALKKAHLADRGYAHGAQALEAALNLDNRRLDIKGMLADALYARALAAERDHQDTLLDDLLDRMSLYDVGGLRAGRWNAPAELKIDADVDGTEVKLSRYAEDESKRLTLVEERLLGTTPLQVPALPRGSYRLVLQAPGRMPVYYPVLLGRQAQVAIKVKLPPVGAIPAGMVYIPPGNFIFGAAGEEALRQKFFNTAPAHEVFSSGYLISQHETTFGEYIEFLKSIPAEQREQHRPKVGSTSVIVSGTLEIKQLESGQWQLESQPLSTMYRALAGQLITYKGRDKHQNQDWLRMPIGGVSRADVMAYAD